MLKNSERNLGVVKNIITSGQRYRQLFGENYKEYGWTQSEITIFQRKNFLLKEPSISCASVDTIEVGPHYSHIIVDDLHSEKNSRTKEQIENVYEHLRLLISLGDAKGFSILVIGTRWAEGDLYGKILESHKNFESMVCPAVWPDGSLFFPEVLSREKLDTIRSIQGLDIFNGQYMNDPLPQGETASFKKNWFRYIKECPKDIDLFITADPAISLAEGSDYFGLAVSGIDKGNNLIVADYAYGNWHPYQAIQKMFDLMQKYPQIKGIGIETNAFQKLYKFQLEAEMRTRNKFIRIYELKHYSQSKIDRILGLQPRYEQGCIYHMEWMKETELEDELLKFPRGKKRDVIDALSFILEIVKPNVIRKKRDEQITCNSKEDMINSLLEEQRKSRDVKLTNCMGDMF